MVKRGEEWFLGRSHAGILAEGVRDRSALVVSGELQGSTRYPRPSSVLRLAFLLDPHLIIQFEVRQSLEDVGPEARECFGVDLDREVHGQVQSRT